MTGNRINANIAEEISPVLKVRSMWGSGQGSIYNDKRMRGWLEEPMSRRMKKSEHAEHTVQVAVKGTAKHQGAAQVQLEDRGAFAEQ
jgi:hypothetical protein